MRLAILASGRGSNLQSLIDHFGPAVIHSPVQICGVICDNPGAMALDRAAKAGVPHVCIDRQAFASKADFEAAMQKQLEEWKAEWIALAGFMRLLSDDFVERWHNRLVNIHPSLLPEFRGLNTHKRALAAGAKRHGCTIHFVRREIDAGPIIMQGSLDITPGDTEDSLEARVLELEHRLYPEALRQLATGRIKVAE